MNKPILFFRDAKDHNFGKYYIDIPDEEGRIQFNLKYDSEEKKSNILIICARLLLKIHDGPNRELDRMPRI